MSPRDKAICLLCRVAMQHDCTLTEIFTRDRTQPIARARQHGYAALAERGWSQSRIGRLFGRDHSTVAHGIAQISEFQPWLYPEWSGGR